MLWKEIIIEFWFRFKRIINEKRAEGKLSELPAAKVVEVIVSGTTYLVSSFYKKNAKCNVVDKISRLIGRDAENIAGKQK